MTDFSAGVVDSAPDLWQAIVRQAGLDLDGYDKQLVTELAGNLGISSKNFERELARAGVTVEMLLIQLLHLIAPYAAMMQDILAFFARARAHSTSENIRVRIEFDSITDVFEFDLRNFQDWEIQFREAVARVLRDEIDDLRALQLRHAFVVEGVTYKIVGATWSNLVPSDVDVARWLVDSGTDQGGLIALPPPPGVADLELRALLARVWRFLRISAFRVANEIETQALSPDDIRLIVRGAYLLHKQEGLLLRRLREVLMDTQADEIETTVFMESLAEVFNLPVWKRRSELYSVWVGARLITAFGQDVRVHVVDRSIVFSFGGAHLATVSLSPEQNLHVWCELRTPASKVIGKGRKWAIQPDYVVLCEPISHPNSAVLVVECKQYLRQSRGGFADALIDYASGHRRAGVALVNYGPTTSSVLERVGEVDATLLTRTRVFGKLRPGSPTVVREFEELVQSVASRVRPHVDVLHEKGAFAPEHDTDTVASVSNHRNKRRANDDHDLHCWVTDTQGGRQHVYYAQRLGNLDRSRVELDQDVRAGGGIETLTWENADSVCLDFAVHAFSPGSDIALSQPQVEANANDSPWVIQPPEGQQGKWWKLFRIEQPGSLIRIWNSIGNEAQFAEEL